MSEKNLVTAIRDTLHDEMAADERIVLLGEDVGVRGRRLPGLRRASWTSSGRAG